MKAQRYFVLLVSTGLVGGMFAGCNNGSQPDANATSAGAGASGDGVTTVVASSSSTTHPGTTSSSSATTSPVTSSSTGSSSPASATSNLGLNCNVDSDCASDGNHLTCATPTAADPVFGGAPGGGYCTKTCKTNDDCPSDGVCVGDGTDSGPKECWMGCTNGPTLTALDAQLDPNKCQGRQDLRCAALNMTDYACAPTCGDDAGCDSSLVCDPRLGVCVEPSKVNHGDAMGSKCDASSKTPTCAGTCVSFTGTKDTICTSPCTLGGDLLTNNDCGGSLAGVCAFAPAGSGAGDSGFCTNSCEKQDDCQNPAFWCFDVNAQNGKGYCFGATDCPNGDADCVDPNTKKPLPETCQDTKYGPKCIDVSKYPLGPAGSGGGDGSGGGNGSGGAAKM